MRTVLKLREPQCHQRTSVVKRAKGKIQESRFRPFHKQIPTMVVQRKLRVMVITMGGYRKQVLEEKLLASDDVEVTFVDGVPSRGLRSRSSFLHFCNRAGLLPDEEWEVLKDALENHDLIRVDVSDILHNVPIVPGRHGSQADREMHYSKEIWSKGKAINRGRAVFACLLAHLIHLRRFTEEGFDVLLEDNVRFEEQWCERIRDIQRRKQNYEDSTQQAVHMMYYGWLGSDANLDWVYTKHRKRRHFQDSIMPFPTVDDILKEDVDEQTECCGCEPLDANSKRKPGGSLVWGAYGYWISKEAYRSLLDSLRKDVGSLLWKGKRQRNYLVKPIDKVLPRRVLQLFGPHAVQLPIRPVAFRAPMLTSKIHTQWDPEFCRSTTLQLKMNGMDWSNLNLTETEAQTVEHWKETGRWVNLSALQSP